MMTNAAELPFVRDLYTTGAEQRLKRTCVVVLGMHRSGTSALARGLSFLGATLPRNVYGAEVTNETGHWEPLPLIELNERLLKDGQSRWDDFRSFNWNILSADQRRYYAAAAKELITQEYGNTGLFVLKEPRICRLVEFYVEVLKSLDIDVRCVLTIRNPLSVSASLERRDGLSAEYSSLIWLRHELEAEFATRGLPRVMVAYEDLVTDWRATMERLVAELGIDFPTSLVEASGVMRNHFSRRFEHHRATPEVLERDCRVPSLVKHAYRSLRAVISSPDRREILGDLDIIRSQFNEQCDIFGDAFYAEIRKECERRADLGLAGQAERIVHLQQAQEHLQAELRGLTLQLYAERRTVLRPIYRNVYSVGGRLIRAFAPPRFAEKVRSLVPNPEGVPARLLAVSKTASRADPSASVRPAASPHPDVFVFSIINWDFRTQRPQHVARELARLRGRVFFFEMEQAATADEIREVARDVYVIRLFTPAAGVLQPYQGNVKRSQAAAWLHSFYEFCDRVLSTSQKDVLIQHPYWWQFLRHASMDYRIVFDCMDDISGFSNTTPEVLSLEEDLVGKADDMVVSAGHLQNKFQSSRNATLIRNAAQVEHFVDAHSGSVPGFLADSGFDPRSRRIRVGYIGAISDWFDIDLLRQVAEENPDFDIHLCGGVTNASAATLSLLNNVTLHGEVRYADAPAFLQQMDVATIPFRLLPIIQACDPVKFYEHCAAGVPTVATRLPELERAKHLVFFADNARTFAEQVRVAKQLRHNPQLQKHLTDYAAANTWSGRAKQFSELLDAEPSVSAVMLSYGDPNITEAALHSLHESGGNYRNLEILLVDNGSAPEAIAQIEAYCARFENVTFIKNGVNLGFAAGNNVGITRATGDYVLLLNNDVYLAPGSIRAMVRHLVRNPQIGVVGPLTNNIGNEARIEISYDSMPDMRRAARILTTGYRGRWSQIGTSAYFAAMFRRRDFEVFGLLPTEYGRGMFEDDDHCASIKSQGYLCALAEDAFIHHELSASFSKIGSEEKSKLFEHNKRIFEGRWGPWVPHQYRSQIARPHPTLDL